jgi:hypothetical protein
MDKDYFHIATEEWINSEELQKRLDKGFTFKCNDCHKIIGEHIKTLAQGIFCEECFNKLMGELING